MTPIFMKLVSFSTACMPDIEHAELRSNVTFNEMNEQTFRNETGHLYLGHDRIWDALHTKVLREKYALRYALHYTAYLPHNQYLQNTSSVTLKTLYSP